MTFMRMFEAGPLAEVGALLLFAVVFLLGLAAVDWIGIVVVRTAQRLAAWRGRRTFRRAHRRAAQMRPSSEADVARYGKRLIEKRR